VTLNLEMFTYLRQLMLRTLIPAVSLTHSLTIMSTTYRNVNTVHQIVLYLLSSYLHCFDNWKWLTFYIITVSVSKTTLKLQITRITKHFYSW